MRHEDRNKASATGASSASSIQGGDHWYKLQAHRAVNQAAGRVIRGRDDFGAVFFLDRRFADHSVRGGLSKWLRDQVKHSFRHSVHCR